MKYKDLIGKRFTVEGFDASAHFYDRGNVEMYGPLEPNSAAELLYAKYGPQVHVEFGPYAFCGKLEDEIGELRMKNIKLYE